MNRILSLAAATAAVLTIPHAALADSAPSSMRCIETVLNVPSGKAPGTTQYTVRCVSADDGALAPTLVFSGDLRLKGGAPYPVHATYQVDARPAYAKALDLPNLNTTFAGALASDVNSVKGLSALFEGKAHWDPTSATLSVEERAGLWRAVSVRFDAASGDPYVLEAGMATAPVVDGQSKADLIFSRAYSRFAAKTHDRMPRVTARLSVRDGKLGLDIEATRVLNADALTDRVTHLDANPAEISRAWAVAAMAQFMGLEEEVRYATQQVAAHNPHLLDEFHANVQAIAPYVLPKN